MSKKIIGTLFVSLIALGVHPQFLLAQQPATQPVQSQAAAPQPNQDKNLKDSLAASNAWLVFVDQGKYGESWDAGALTFQYTITRNEWIKALTLGRQPLGSTVSRELIRQDPAMNPMNLPAGEYMVIYYKTSFSNRPTAHERVILQQQNNGQWKMLTYDVS